MPTAITDSVIGMVQPDFFRYIRDGWTRQYGRPVTGIADPIVSGLNAQVKFQLDLPIIITAVVRYTWWKLIVVIQKILLRSQSQLF